jgi:AraC-like DNA-binding protein
LQTEEVQHNTSLRARIGNDSPLLSTLVTTDLFPDAQQFDAWVRQDDRVFELTAEKPAEGFSACRTSWKLGGLLLTQDRLAPHRFERTAANIRSEPIDHWYFVLQQKGANEAIYGDRVARTLPGQMAFRSLGRPLSGIKSVSESLALFIPRDEFWQLAPALDQANNTVLERPLDRLLADYLLALERQLPCLTMDEIPAILSMTRAMIAACMAPTPDRMSDAGGAMTATVFERARGYIRANLHSPSLGAERLCRVLGVSRRKLSQLFERFGGVALYIRKQRLAACHAEIVEPLQVPNIQTIAHYYGFTGSGQFNRLFRDEFGYSPSEARDAARNSRAAHPKKPSHLRELLQG